MKKILYLLLTVAAAGCVKLDLQHTQKYSAGELAALPAGTQVFLKAVSEVGGENIR